jgi:Protein of unknown function (DUF3592)
MNESFGGPEMTTDTAQKGPLMWLGLIVLVALSGLCTIFVSVATAANAWQARAQARWPQATARVDRCSLDRTSSNGSRKVHITCRLSYAVGPEQNVAEVYSSNVAAPEIWQYPRNQIGPLQEWLKEHAEGTPIVVRYDPANHIRVVLVSDNMPFGGSRTVKNVQLLEICAGLFLILLMIARITWPRSSWQNRYSSMPQNS